MAAECRGTEDLADFVLEYSRTLLECLADDPSVAYSWESVLPPESMLSRGRCLDLLRRLRKLHYEPHPPPLRICSLRLGSLYESLTGCDADEIADASRVAEYLQLPVGLTQRVEQQACAESVSRSPAPLSTAIAASAVLQPFLRQTEDFIQSNAAPAPWPGFWRPLEAYGRPGSTRSAHAQAGLWAGLCGDACSPAAELSALGAAAWLMGFVTGLAFMRDRDATITGPLPGQDLLKAAAPHCAGPLSAATACAVGAAAFFGHADLLRAVAEAGWPLHDGHDGHGEHDAAAISSSPSASSRETAPGKASRAACTGDAVVARVARVAGAGVSTAAGDADCDGDDVANFDLGSSVARPMSAIAWACAGGHLQLVKALLLDSSDRAKDPARAGDEDAGSAAVMTDCGGSESACTVTTIVGRSDRRVIEPFPAAYRVRWQAADSILAAAHGHVHILRWAWRIGLPIHALVPVSAAQAGFAKGADVLRFLVEEMHWRWRSGDAAACAAAAAAGDLRLLQLLSSLGCPWDASQVTHLAASAGSLPILEWAVSQGAPLDDSVAAEAASAGSLAILDWLRNAQGVAMEGDASIVSAAAGAGHIHVLRWCREEVSPPLPLTFEATARAAAGGHLAALQWLRAQRPPCPWNSTAVEMARRRGHDDVADWTIANGCPAGHLRWRREGQREAPAEPPHAGEPGRTEAEEPGPTDAAVSISTAASGGAGAGAVAGGVDSDDAEGSGRLALGADDEMASAIRSTRTPASATSTVQWRAGQ